MAAEVDKALAAQAAGADTLMELSVGGDLDLVRREVLFHAHDLRKRQQRTQQAQENRALVIAEEERLDEQIKLIRADAIAARNTEALTARIDATVEHLDQTNKWISELDECKDLVGDLPPTDLRVGYEPAPPPPVIQEASVQRGPARGRQKTY